MPGGTGSEEIKYGGARALIKQRGDGLWVIRWREAGRGKNTTRGTQAAAREAAKKLVRTLAAGQGGRLMTVDDAQIVARVKSIAGQRSAFALLGEVEDALRELKGAPLSRAVNHWRASGMGEVELVPVNVARIRFMDLYAEGRRARETRAGIRKELKAFTDEHGQELAVCELSVELLERWIRRPKESGEEIGARFFNNRLATWKTFLNQCREWRMWPRGEKHPAELITPRTEPKGAPPIWAVATLQAALACPALPVHLQRYLALGCWAGLRPFEIRRIAPEDFDFERDYIEVRPAVAMKTMDARFIPLEPCLKKWLLAQGWPPEFRDTHGREHLRRQRIVCLWHSQNEAMEILRRAGILESWPQDVMRHSYISYRIARGDGIGIVAEHAGNSERVIRKAYRRPLRKEEGAAWFEGKAES